MHAPDGQDLAMTIAAVEKHHLVTLTLDVRLGDLGHNKRLVVTVKAHTSHLISSGMPLSFETISEYPCVHYRTLDACMYHAVLRMDAILTQKNWKQQELL